jgi:hypothetical protein
MLNIHTLFQIDVLYFKAPLVFRPRQPDMIKVLAAFLSHSLQAKNEEFIWPFMLA